MVFDGTNTTTDTVTISVQADNDAPTVDAGSDQTAREGDVVSLVATAGDPEGQGLTHAWTQVSGTAISLTGGTTATPSFTAPELLGDEDLIFEVAVSDGTSTTTDTVTVSVQAANDGPTVDAGFDQTVTEGNSVTLGATATDPEGQSLRYSWSQIGGTPVSLTGATTLTPSFTIPQLRSNEDLVFEVTATDGTNTTTDTVMVHALAVDDAPSVDAGASRTVNVGDSVTLSATAADPEGQSLTSSWTQVSGPRVALGGGSTAGFVAPSLAQDQDLVFRITTSDGANAVTDTVAITVLKDTTPLTISVGNRWNADVGDNVNLTVNASGPGYAPIQYAWTQVGGQPTLLSGANTASPSFVVPSGSAGEQLLFQVDVTVGNESVSRSVLVDVGSTGSSHDGDSPGDLADVPGLIPVPPAEVTLSAEHVMANLSSRGMRPQVLEVMEVGEKGLVTAVTATTVGAQIAGEAHLMAVEDRPADRFPDDVGQAGRVASSPRPVDTEGRLPGEQVPDRFAEKQAPEPLERPSMWVKVWAGLVAFFRTGALSGKIPKD